MDDYCKLMQIADYDKEFCEKYQKLIPKFRKWNVHKIVQENFSFFKKHLKFSGSVSEGGALARMFLINDMFFDNVNREIEFDFEYLPFDIPIEMKSYVESLQGKKLGYVKIKVEDHLLETIEKSLHPKELKPLNIDFEVLMKKITKNNYFRPFRMKELALKKVNSKGDDNSWITAAAFFLGKKPSDIELIKVEQSVVKASVQTDLLFAVEGNIWCKISYDLVLLVKINWWPEIAQEWKERKRNWPQDQQLIEQLTQYSYIIAKSSNDEKCNQDTNEMRYSFSHIEKQLVSLRTRHQHMIYFIFKSMIYRWLVPINTEQVKSFLGKTVMFWVCEDKHQNDNIFWDESYSATLNVLRYLFKKMLKYLKNVFMPYYFVPTINVIEPVTSDVRTDLVTQISSMLENIQAYLPNFSQIKDAVHDFMNLADSINTIVEQTEKKDWLASLLKNVQ